MLTCRDVAALLTEYFDGALPVSDSVRLQLHLALCRHCRAFVSQMKLTSGVLRQLPADEELPPETREALLARFRTWKDAGSSTEKN